MRLKKFYENIQQDLKLFGFILCLVCIYRVWFMWQMSGYMGEGATFGDVFTALWAGLRLSLKTAGGVALLSFVFVTLLNLGMPGLSLEKLRLGLGTAASFLLAVLFQARFPYYREFHMTYYLQVIQGANENPADIFWMAVQEYGFCWRFALAVLLTILCWKLLKKLLRLGTFALPLFVSGKWKWFFSGALAVGIFLFMFFVRFGGSFGYEGGINWEHAGVTNDAFLNECVLDDVQALYRAHSMEERTWAGEISGVQPERIREFAKAAAHDGIDADNLVPYLERSTKGAKLPKPQHIFIILEETGMQWPLLEQYASLHVAEGIKGIRAAHNAYYSRAFISNGDFTSSAITGLVTGLSEVNIRVSYHPRTYEGSYPVAMAEAFHGLGYQVDFWYGGIPSWDSIERITRAQGFDHFYGYPDLNAPKQNTWGAKDEFLFDAIERHLEAEMPTVHLIMTTTNHPPYNLDLSKEGFDLEGVKEEVSKMPHVDDPEELAVELGHYWYMDKCVASFVRTMMEKYPESLFVITGDHAVRCNPGTQPTMFEQQSVPFLLYGHGVTKDILPPDTVGGHTSIVPTLIELIAPEGYVYHSIAPPMTESEGIAFNRDFWVTEKLMGAVDSDRVEYLPGIESADEAAARDRLSEVLPRMRTLSWWLLERGTDLSGEKDGEKQ